MERRFGPFRIFVGCFSAVGVVFTIIGVIVAIAALFYPRQFAVTLENILPTSTPLVVTLPTQTPLPTPTPYPTQTPYPTYTPYPTPTPQPTPPTATPSPPPVLELPFEDTFDSGSRPEWRPISGDWRMINGWYTATGSNNEWVYSVVGDPNWRDYVVEADYSFGGVLYPALAILVRASGTTGLGLSFQIVGHPSYDIRWCAWKDGGWSPIAYGPLPGNSGHIRVEVRGSTFTASIDALNQLSITDSSTAKGYVGLGITCDSVTACGAFDNFHVTRIAE